MALSAFAHCYNGPVNYDPDTIFEAYLDNIQRLNIPNRRLYIAYSAVTGSGKTWLAKRIATHFSGLYLSADELRTAAQELYPMISRSELDQFVAQYAPSIQNRLLEYPNHLHVVDTNIDKYAQQVFDKAAEIEFPLFIIRLDVDKSTLADRIATRQKNIFQDEKMLLESLDQNIKYHDEFLKNFGNRISYTYSEEGGLEHLFASIEQVLNEQA